MFGPFTWKNPAGTWRDKAPGGNITWNGIAWRSIGEKLAHRIHTQEIQKSGLPFHVINPSLINILSISTQKKPSAWTMSECVQHVGLQISDFPRDSYLSYVAGGEWRPNISGKFVDQNICPRSDVYLWILFRFDRFTHQPPNQDHKEIPS